MILFKKSGADQMDLPGTERIRAAKYFADIEGRLQVIEHNNEFVPAA
jgi:hypothetical protein